MQWTVLPGSLFDVLNKLPKMLAPPLPLASRPSPAPPSSTPMTPTCPPVAHDVDIAVLDPVSSTTSSPPSTTPNGTPASRPNLSTSIHPDSPDSAAHCVPELSALSDYGSEWSSESSSGRGPHHSSPDHDQQHAARHDQYAAPLHYTQSTSTSLSSSVRSHLDESAIASGINVSLGISQHSTDAFQQPLDVSQSHVSRFHDTQ